MVLLITEEIEHEYRYTCVYAYYVALLRVLTFTVLLTTPAMLSALHLYSVKLSFCSIVTTNVGMPPMVVVLVTFLSTRNPSINQRILAGGIPVAGQNSRTLLPGMTNKFCRPAPDTAVPGMLGSDIVVFIVGGSA